MSEPPIFHDTYTGPRWTYGLNYRPCGLSGTPKGFIHAGKVKR